MGEREEVAKTDMPVEIKSVEVLRLQPGDYLICELAMPIHEDGRRNIHAQLVQIFDGVVEAKKVVVAMPGMEIKVVRPDVAGPLLYGDPMEGVD